MLVDGGVLQIRDQYQTRLQTKLTLSDGAELIWIHMPLKYFKIHSHEAK